MRILHCADIHLDSPMTTHFDAEKAKLRREEILHTFRRMVDYAKEHKIDAIMIAGDLFDRAQVSYSIAKEVESVINDARDILFFYLRGNHDHGSFESLLSQPLRNLFTFDENWKYYRMNQKIDGRNVIIAGVEFTNGNNAELCQSLNLNREDINIVMLHGQQTESASKDRESIDLSLLRRKGIDYLALGHVHEHSLKALDERGVYCYPGCLEGRGFDECGVHGFEILDINVHANTNKRIRNFFVPFGKRQVQEISVDVTGAEDSFEISKRIEQTLMDQKVSSVNMISIVLTGSIPVSTKVLCDYIKKQFEHQYFAVRIKNETAFAVNYADYEKDASFRGEYVRQVLADEGLTEAEKAELIHFGFQALGGEDF